jgi:hypothetical protein
MIRIVLLGRTGNNLFQYALGRVLAEKHQVPLVLDGSWFNQAGWREVSHLLNLPLRARVARRFPFGARALRKLTGKHYWEFRNVPVLRENPADQSFDSRFLDSPADCVLFGYFQTPLYFESIADEFRSEINGMLEAALTLDRRLVEELAAPGSVAVHVRRGDYLHLPVFQVCGTDYYREAMTQMRERLDRPRFFVFSDDPGWCRGAFRADDETVIDSLADGDNPLLDLRLMSLASHHIICNSSYSWWAAWLGDKPGQRVIMPERWYASDIKAPIEEKEWKAESGKLKAEI